MRLEAARPRRFALLPAARARRGLRFAAFPHARREASSAHVAVARGDEDWIVSARWSAAFALALLLHLPVLRIAALNLVEQAQWLAGPDRGAGSNVISVYELYMVTRKAVDEQATASPAVVAASATPTPAESKVQTEAPTKVPAAPAPDMREAGGGGRDDYYARLRAHLQRYRRQVQADAAGTRTVVVRFRVDGRGGVSAIGLQRSSGDARLDAEALDLVRRSSPVPAPPRQAGMNLAVPIEFD